MFYDVFGNEYKLIVIESKLVFKPSNLPPTFPPPDNNDNTFYKYVVFMLKDTTQDYNKK